MGIKKSMMKDRTTGARMAATKAPFSFFGSSMKAVSSLSSVLMVGRLWEFLAASASLASTTMAEWADTGALIAPRDGPVEVVRFSIGHDDRENQACHHGGHVAGQGRVGAARGSDAEFTVVDLGHDKPGCDSRAETADRARYCAQTGLAFPGDGEGGRKHGTADQEAHSQ
jgi:hypothetical protein